MSTTGDPIFDRLRPHDIRLDGDAVSFFVVRAAAADLARVLALIAVDTLAVAVSPAVFRPVIEYFGGTWTTTPAGGILPLIATVLVAVAAVGGYGRSRLRLRPRAAASAGALAVLIGAAWLPLAGSDVQTAWIMGVASALFAILAGRFAVARTVAAVRRMGRFRVRTVLVGSTASAADVADRLQREGGGIDVVARLTPATEADASADGRIEDLEEMLRDRLVDRVILAERLPPDVVGSIFTACFRRGTRVERMSERIPVPSYGLDRHIRRDGKAVEVRPAAPGVPQMALKRAFDIVVSTALMVMLSPMFFLIAVAIRLDSPGPTFFGQRRVGVGGRTFTMWKFRTMVDGADRLKADLLADNESEDPRLFKISSDPRVTRVGAWLRRTSLDELPQLFNVLRGEMSLVGPRPFFPEDLEHYEPRHFERLTVLPGMTGLWQVSGRSDIRDFDAVAELDREYIRRWSVGLDLKILLRTIPVVLNRDGAY